MDEMQLGEEKKPEPVPETPIEEPQPHPEEGVQEGNPAPTEGGGPVPPPSKKPITRERSIEELSMSDDDSPPAKKYPVKTAFVPPEKKEELTMDVFKNLYSEFKEFIPSKDKKEETAVKKEKPGIMQKARGFFGL